MENTKICIVCGKDFYKKINESKKYWSGKKYCSCECSYSITLFKKGQIPWIKGRKGIRAGELNNKWKGGLVTKNCITCDKEFKVDPFRKDRAKFCSHRCHSDSLKGKSFCKETEFKPLQEGMKSVNASIRNINRYRDWRIAVFQRDDYTCQKCGIRTQKGIRVMLNAHHHLNRFADLIKEYEIKTTKQAIECDKLWDLSLAITLCRNCHIEAHTNDVYNRSIRL